MTHLIERYWCGDAICPHREFLVLPMLGKFHVTGDFHEYLEPCFLPTDVCLEGAGVVYTKITAFKKGVVRLDDNWWWFALANSDMTIYPGQQVYVVGLQGHTLLVDVISSE
ncbi:MAG: hypothetical protein KTR27_16815 [Leptolyngbyaceae cyanobacterium MAG.088]|nr:hypothetical protein [Leptolyngbyaceae cyanobacterium MAG.088]